MSLDKAVKTYKARVKESQTVLEELEERAADYAERREYAEDASTLLEDAQTGLDALENEVQTLQGEVARATLADDTEAVRTLQERYRSLENERASLEGRVEQLRGVLEDNTLSPGDVAKLKAELQTCGASGGSELVQAVHELVEQDSGALRARADDAQGLLPDVDALTYLEALGSVSSAYRGMYEGWRDHIEAEREHGRGRSAEERLAYRLDRTLAR